MTNFDIGPAMDVPMWRALDLQRAYAYGHREAIASMLAELDVDGLDRAVQVLITNFNDDIRGLARLLGAQVTPHAVLREIDQVAAYAPPEQEFAITTAVREVAGGRSDMTAALALLAPVDRAHVLAVYLMAVNVAATSRAEYQRRLEAAAGITARMLGKPRPYLEPLP